MNVEEIDLSNKPVDEKEGTVETVDFDDFISTGVQYLSLKVGEEVNMKLDTKTGITMDKGGDPKFFLSGKDFRYVLTDAETGAKLGIGTWTLYYALNNVLAEAKIDKSKPINLYIKHVKADRDKQGAKTNYAVKVTQ